jgi:hypothetical protein
MKNEKCIRGVRNAIIIKDELNLYKNISKSILRCLNYKILNPGGNKTALVYNNKYTKQQKKLINKIIMDEYSEVEQVGFLSKSDNRLEMAGGEFCMNAARCAIYEYAKDNKDEIELFVSGTNNRLVGRILENNIVEIKLTVGKNINNLIETKDDFTCINMDGILIAILNKENSKKYIEGLKRNEKIFKQNLKQLMIKKFDSKEKAIGIIFLEKINRKYKNKSNCVGKRYRYFVLRNCMWEW